ncbi:DUF7604 domain-containing protein [Allofournierella sp. CML151]|uniref:DUF7604 domain-containing protein n=1 Tax=Allofournierella sp. CML151 TaxID=2998082 RepID=UPI0022EA0FF2|nr:VWA domain-containing protein [Fournierella sp. CML151]
MKHKMWSRLLSMALAVMMIASIVPNSAFAEAASEITSTSQVQVEETPVEETQTPQEEVTVPEAETPAEPSTEPAPTEEPVAEPTAEPTVEPTAEPTQAPAETVAPSEEPSAEPTAAPEATEIPEGTAVPSETPAPSASPLPSESPVPSETPVPTETPEATEKPAIDGQALLDELMAIEDDEAFMKAVNELTEEQAAALEALGEEALAEYALRVESLTAQEETVELNAEDKEFTAAVKDAEGVTVTVKVPAGSLPVNAQLVAEMIEQDTEKYTKAEEALADETLNEQPTEYAGMVAMDIRFEVDGEEIEPLQPVEMTIDAQALLPEDADPETVAVQHLKEDETGAVVAVETVADATEETGDVTVEATQTEEPAMDMASTFAVDGFSTFTITWGFYDGSVTVHYVNTDGFEIEGTQKYGEKFANREWVDLSDYAGQIEGYEFVEYKYGSDFDSSYHMADAGEEPQIRYNSGYYYRLDGYSNGERIFYYASADERNIYLVYEENSQSIDPGVTSATVTTGKTLVLQQGQQAGGLYDLTLSVSGDRGSSEQKAMLDILFIVDSSGSMDGSRLRNVKTAINTITNNLNRNEDLDTRYAAVKFSGSTGYGKYDDAGTVQSWTGNVTTFQNKVAWISATGGTNYEAGLMEGKELLTGAREGAVTAVIFLSDGKPGYYYDNDGYTAGSGNSYNSTAQSHAEKQCNTLDVDYFYTIGVGDEDNLETNMKALADAAWLVPDSNRGYYMANDLTELNDVFDKIEASITFYACQDVTLTDTMSGYAEVVPADDGSYTFTITVKNGDIEEDTQTVTLAANETRKIVSLNGIEGDVILTFQDGTITLEFPTNYQLEKDHTYSVTTTVKPTEAAITAGTEGYDGRGDAGTGTHAGQSGFYSNVSDSSKVTFKPTVNGQAGEEKSELFPKPVIQIFDPGDVEMETPAHTKQAILNDDGTYDLTLTVSGSTGTATKKAQVDVLMVVDVSNSMNENGRLGNTKNAMKALVEELEGNDTVDARYSIVTFSGPQYTNTDGSSNNAQVKLDWNSNTADVKNSISKISTSGATNYEAGLEKAVQQLASARSTASTVVVFLSDGAPTVYNGGGDGENNLSLTDTGWKNTLAEAAKVSCSQFYAVGIGETQEKYMTDIRDSVNAVSKEYFAANSDGSNLADKFKDIAGSVTALACENVTITDILSQYAEAVLSTSGTPEKLKIKVTDANGTDVTEVEQQAGNITAAYDSVNKTVTLDFDDSYQLKANYTYAVTLKIKPTDEAIQYLNENGGVYPNTPDSGTGTHADKHENGFFSNTEATLTYQVTGIPGQNTVSYDKPVIRVNKGDLLITKTIEGLSESEIETLKDTLVFTYTNVDNPNDKGTVNFAEMNLVDGVYQATVKNLDANAAYTVTEAGYQVDGYDCTTSQPTEPVVIPNGGTATAAFTNTYTPSNMELTIVKNIQGNPYDDGRDMFSFKITCRESANQDNIGKVWYVHLDGAGQKTITLPVGKYEVTEMDNIHYKLVRVAPEPTDTLYELKENSTITFTNEPVKSNIPTDGGGVENQFALRGQDIVITANKIDGDTEVTPTTSGQ